MGFLYADVRCVDDVTCAFQGHGLSYTSFTYSNFAELDSTAMCTKGSAVAASSRGGQARSPLVTCIRATVTNDGAVAGAELAQLYVRFPQRADDPDVAGEGHDNVRLST